MVRNNFKVVYSRKDILEASAILLVVELVLLMCEISVWEQHTTSGKIVVLSFIPVIMLINAITRLLYYVKVNDANIIFKTRYGKKYRFLCGYIKKVACFTDNDPKHGVSHDITMKVDIEGKEVLAYASSRMKGFSTMAAYLLEMHERGEIKEEAISKSCKKMLTKYKNLEEKK